MLSLICGSPLKTQQQGAIVQLTKCKQCILITGRKAPLCENPLCAITVVKNKISLLFVFVDHNVIR